MLFRGERPIDVHAAGRPAWSRFQPRLRRPRHPHRGYTAWDAYDANYTALRGALAEWCRTDVNYAGRIAHLKDGNGLNGPVAFGGTIVSDDRATDVLTSDATDTLAGGAGDDWYLSNFAGGGKLDNVTDGKAGELKTDLA